MAACARKLTFPPVVPKARAVPPISLVPDETSPPQAVRVVGTLALSNIYGFVLVLTDGTAVPVHIEEQKTERLVGARVAVSGMAHYRSTGEIFRVVVESLAQATDSDLVFAKLPIRSAHAPLAVPVAQDEGAGVSAFFGIWPGDESENELIEAVRAIG